VLFSCFGATLRLLATNTLSSVSRHQQTPPLTAIPTMSVTNLPQSGGTVLITLDGGSVDNTGLSEILVKNSDFSYPTCSRRPLKGLPVGISHSWRLVWKKRNGVATRWLKNWRYVYSFTQNSRTWQTDGQADIARRHGPRLCIASRGNETVHR